MFDSTSRSARYRLIWLSMSLLALLISACTLSSGETEEIEAVFTGPPVVLIASPLPNSTYMVGTDVNILARIENAGPEMSRIIVQVNETVIGDQDVSSQAGAPAFSISQSWPALSAGSYTLSVTAVRPDGTRSEGASVALTVREAADMTNQTDTSGQTDSSGQANTGGQTDTSGQASTGGQTDTSGQTGTGGQTGPGVQAAPATNTPRPVPQVVVQTRAPAQPTATPEAPPATATSSRPTVRIITGANIRSGPSVVFNPPIGSLAAGAETDLLGRNPAGDWYKIRYFNAEGWIAASLAEARGDLSTLPVDVGPPTPVPTATPIPATPTPQPRNVDLSITNSNTNPFPLRCGQASRILITVVNTGTDLSTPTNVVVDDLYNGQVIESTAAPIGALAQNQSATVELFLTVSTFVNEGHVHRIRVDADNLNAETNEGNNAQQFDYVLAPC